MLFLNVCMCWREGGVLIHHLKKVNLCGFFFIMLEKNPSGIQDIFILTIIWCQGVRVGEQIETQTSGTI